MRERVCFLNWHLKSTDETTEWQNNNNNNNRRNSHGHHGSKRRELAQHAHSRGSHAFTRTLTSTQLQLRCAKRQLSYYRIWNRICILKVPEIVKQCTHGEQKLSTKAVCVEDTHDSPTDSRRGQMLPLLQTSTLSRSMIPSVLICICCLIGWSSVSQACCSSFCLSATVVPPPRREKWTLRTWFGWLCCI